LRAAAVSRRALATAVWLVAARVAFAAAPLNIWLDVPFVAQQKNGCGPASIAMVMEYWQKQHAAAHDDAAEIMRTLAPGRHGVRASDMARGFEQHNYRVFAYAGDWSDIEHQLTQGRPLIAAVKPEGGGDDLHYVVIAGIDDAQQLVLLNDPAQRKLLKESRAQFEHEWKVTENWTLLAVPAK
jgi:ABC-type bacteriocin/lantibiotic exporter with double-glycine peptidase domain